MSALAHILAPVFGLNNTAGLDAANMYYGRDAQKRKLAAELLAKHNITEEMIHAKALAQHSGAIAYIDRMIVSREVARNRLFRDHERRNDAAKSTRGRGSVGITTPRPALPKRPGMTIIS